MARCHGCGKGFGFFEDGKRMQCKYCASHGCKYCGRSWISFPLLRGYDGTRPMYSYDRFCSQGCAVAYIATYPRVIENYGEISYSYAALSFQGALYLFFHRNYDFSLLNRHIENPMAQGIVKMSEASKDLNYQEMLDGLKLCRRDPVYATYKAQMDDLGERYIKELKRYDVPTTTAQIGGVSITLAIPQNQTEMRVHSCPSCGAPLDRIAVRGQVMRCDHCNCTFQIT